MNRPQALLMLLPLLFVAGFARAGDADATDRAALTACLSGDYGRGIALLTELYVETKDPTYLYNQGRCYEQNRRYDDAIASFQEYLRAGRKLRRAERADAETHIADCKELLLSSQTAPQPVEAPRPAAPVPISAPAVAPPPVATPTPTLVQEPAVPQVANGSGLRTAGLVSASVGGAALITGVVLNLKVNSMANDLEKTDHYSAAKESDRKTYETLGWVAYGAGAACVATGAVLYVLGLRAASTPSIAITPTFAPNQAGAALEGAF